MSKETPIQWCDSSVNMMMGCDGCELWDEARGVRHCYAGALTERWAGRKGWPESFDKPALFTGRLAEALRWRDLQGQRRPGKPWLDGYPRTIFLNDMGDTFTESLPLDWLDPMVPQMAAGPHVWIILTKRPQRMLQWACQRQEPLPDNFWLCVSVTGPASLGRLRPVYELREMLPEHVIGLSIEPLLGDILPGIRQHYPDLAGVVSWVKIGGESDQQGEAARPCPVEWIEGLREHFQGKGVAVFVKQLGSNPSVNGTPLRLADGHGGDWNEWPAELRVREMPSYCATGAMA
jgi:protein gp37